MAKLILAAERLDRARKLIQAARDLPLPERMGKYDLSYIAGVKDLLRQARDLIKLIPKRAAVTPEMKADVKQILEAADQANQDILH
ncbi:MAG: hypothetical protein QGM50_05430 [Anaerolineae bacterium]|nr:hypothetical protein [Anaerolineae bacterium]MDK1118218.1 hypothetical protein [Anaerolineae bacterium]